MHGHREANKPFARSDHMVQNPIIALKQRHIFLWAINLNAIKTLSTG